MITKDNYYLLNGTAYNKQTPQKLAAMLETIRENGTRVRIYYGEPISGQDWEEQYHTVGYIGRSTGEIKIPLLVYNKRSVGGEGLIDYCIVKIEHANKKIHGSLYEHSNYHLKIQDDISAIPTVSTDGTKPQAQNTNSNNLYKLSGFFNQAVRIVREWFDPGIIPLQNIK